MPHAARPEPWLELWPASHGRGAERWWAACCSLAILAVRLAAAAAPAPAAVGARGSQSTPQSGWARPGLLRGRVATRCDAVRSATPSAAGGSPASRTAGAWRGRARSAKRTKARAVNRNGRIYPFLPGLRRCRWGGNKSTKRSARKATAGRGEQSGAWIGSHQAA